MEGWKLVRTYPDGDKLYVKENYREGFIKYRLCDDNDLEKEEKVIHKEVIEQLYFYAFNKE